MFRNLQADIIETAIIIFTISIVVTEIRQIKNFIVIGVQNLVIMISRYYFINFILIKIIPFCVIVNYYFM